MPLRQRNWSLTSPAPRQQPDDQNGGPGPADAAVGGGLSVLYEAHQLAAKAGVRLRIVTGRPPSTPARILRISGLDLLIFGVLIVLIVLAEPGGLEALARRSFAAARRMAQPAAIVRSGGRR